MPNHYHLIVRSVHGDLSAAMKFITSQFARRLNHRHRWDGPVFRGRFRSQLVENPRHLRYLLPYLHLNPVRAKLVTRPEAECWTSHRAYLELERRPDWLTTRYFLDLLGGKDGLKEVVTGLHKGRIPWPPGFNLASGAWVDHPGDEEAARTEAPSAPARRPAKLKEPERLSTADVIGRVLSITGSSRDALLEGKRGPRANEARRFAVWALVHRNAARHAEAARALKMTVGAVGKASSRVRRTPADSTLGAWMKRWDESAPRR
jgi:hypothetical protein